MQLTFTIFSDLHYKKGMYAATVDDLTEIFSRAEKNGSQFVIHLGDLCNDYKGSPELVNAYLKNKQGLPVYGLYGNHELEANNSMEDVTPLLTNDQSVVWGTEDGSLDPKTAYYYKDIEGFRLIFTDSNYSLTPEGEFEHNRTGSWGPPSENTGANCLSDKQFAWLRAVLFDGADKGLKCIVLSHAAFAEGFSYSTDSEKVRNLLNEVNGYKKGTVIAAINGHWHANAHEIKDNILYFNINSAKNGCWLPVKEPHYLPEHTSLFIDFDAEESHIVCSIFTSVEVVFANACSKDNNVKSVHISAVATDVTANLVIQNLKSKFSTLVAFSCSLTNVTKVRQTAC